MDQYYNKEVTARKIDTIAAEQTANQKQLAQVDIDKVHYQISSANNDHTWKLIHVLDDNDAEEVVLRVQGIICSKTLPPIKYPFRIDPRQRSFLRQTTTLSGLGSECFSKAIQGIRDIHAQFSRTFKDGCLEQWVPNQFEGHDAIDTTNRFFTPRSLARTEEITPFSDAVDPDGILTSAMNIDNKFTHTIDNEVEYYECITHDNNFVNYEMINPIKFRAGDIVEAQLSFVCVALKNAKFKMLVVLRALTLMDTSPLREASISRNRFKNEVVTRISIKRKVGYSDDEIAETRNRMSRMRLE